MLMAIVRIVRCPGHILTPVVKPQTINSRTII